MVSRLEAEPGFRRRVETAVDRGIPPSQLDGREPAVTTDYVYDRGRLVRSVTTSEPRWTEQDRAEALALSAYRGALCPCGCGRMARQTLIPEDQGPVWQVEQTTCTARLALLEAQRGAAEKRGAENALARLWSVRPRQS